MQVLVRDNNVEQALRVLKKKMQREGVFREMKRAAFYEKPSEKAACEKSEAIRRARKLARKQAIREGLIAAGRESSSLTQGGDRLSLMNWHWDGAGRIFRPCRQLFNAIAALSTDAPK